MPAAETAAAVETTGMTAMTRATVVTGTAMMRGVLMMMVVVMLLIGMRQAVMRGMAFGAPAIPGAWLEIARGAITLAA